MDRNQAKTVNRNEMRDVLLSADEHSVVPLLVTGTSMVPFLLDRRSVVELEKDTARKPRRGDIVLFHRRDGTIVLHRVIRAEEECLLINGDAQDWTEEIHPRQVLAYVTHIRRRKRRFPVTNPIYRLYVWVWMPLRWFHPIASRLFHIWHRIPYKLFPRYMAKRNGS